MDFTPDVHASESERHASEARTGSDRHLQTTDYSREVAALLAVQEALLAIAASLELTRRRGEATRI